MASEQALLIDGAVGPLQALYQPCEAPRAVLLICHPHPLFGGSMLNKVVSTVQRTARDLSLVTLRFNFRGVGQSAGEHAGGEGEIDDAAAALTWLREQHPTLPIYLAGFSFGSCVAACLAGRMESAGIAIERLIMLAPPVERFSVDGRLPSRSRFTVIQPEDDEVVTPQRVYDWSARLAIEHELLRVPACSHFFHGKLVELKDLLLSRLS
ncbi:alpha/beta hydrolase [Atopomonas sediminilitoris]|uniref:alpha/beta hydrolase n=1 Tax=Atopomonas sediminilitoris TaxID=2919919 RepID=UPI001F4ED7D9|nr:alpha/beta fold hydrolase [Atopomonas sediminilitoris]MCJ8169649.1 alpha/beta fold hydrolase [Atopomonas sediminilitoris]